MSDSGKQQVAIAVRALRSPGPVPTPMLMLSIGSQGNEQCIYVWRGLGMQMEETKVLRAPLGPVTSHQAAAWAAEICDDVYFMLWQLIGVQGELEDWPAP